MINARQISWLIAFGEQERVGEDRGMMSNDGS
jgi:hypothetical protein